MRREEKGLTPTTGFPSTTTPIGRLLRQKDFADTPLGPIESWPDALRISVENIMNNSFPIGIAWGEELNHLYNDAYAELLADKHPDVLGLPTRDVWPEAWNDIKPMIQTIKETGRPVVFENARFHLLREGGLRESYFTFCYSPIFGLASTIQGYQVTATETTQMVLSQRRLETVRELSESVLKSDSPRQVFERALHTLERHHEDLPLGLLYFQDLDPIADPDPPQKAAFIGSFGTDLTPLQSHLPLDPFRAGATAKSHHPLSEFLLGDDDLDLLSLPLRIDTDRGPQTRGYLLIATSPLLRLDRAYLTFLEEITHTICAAYTTLLARITRQKLARAHEENKRLTERAHLLESIDDPFYALDHHFRITYVNAAARKDPSWPDFDARGKVLWEVFPELKSTRLPDDFQTALDTGQNQIIELHYPPTDQYYQARAFPWEDGLFVSFRDVTAQREFQQHLIQARQRAEEMTRLKSALLANMSHEVRTPLTSIIGMATMLSRQVPPELKKQAEHIERAGKRLARTLDSVLTLAQLESAPRNDALSPVHLAREARDAVDALISLADQSNIELRLHVHDEPCTVRADRAYLHSIFNNLIANAIKFTAPNRHVDIHILSDPHRGILRIDDPGIGIGPDFLPHLFDEFRQASLGLSRSHGGVGLGLNITRRMILAMNGTISVLSTPGVGTTFTVTLPRDPAP